LHGGVNCDTITSNGIWYWNVNGPSQDLGNGYADGALYSAAYNDIWAVQIAQCYRNGRLFTRGKSQENGGWSAWKAVLYDGDSHTHTNTTVTGTLKIGSGSNIASLKMDNSSLSIDKELKLTTGGTSDICSGIACALKAARLQATDFICENIFLGASSGSSSNLPLKIRKYTSISSQAPVKADANILVTIDTSGKVSAKGGFYETSDARLKNFTNKVDVDLDKITNLTKSYFYFKNDDNTLHLGVSAQEIQEVYPELVTSDSETGYLSVAYDKLSVIALAAIDKLYEEQKQLKSRLDRLESVIMSKGV
jgi:hypothetical protein